MAHVRRQRCQNDPLLLIGVDLRKEVGLFRRVPQGFVSAIQAADALSARARWRGRRAGHMPGDQRIVSSNQLERERPGVALSHRSSRFARSGRERWRPRISLMLAQPAAIARSVSVIKEQLVMGDEGLGPLVNVRWVTIIVPF